jgi:hypothetical protein
MFRLTTFLKRAPGVDRARFVDGWTGEISERVLAHGSVKRSARRYVVNLPFPVVAPESLWIVFDNFDGVAEIWFDDLPAAVITANSLAADAGIAAVAEKLIDIGSCISWIGAVVEDFDNTDVAVKRMVAGQPKPSLTIEEAQDYFLHEHSEFFKGYPAFLAYMRSYRLIYGIPTPALKLRSHHLMGMSADIGYRTVQDLAAAFLEPTHAKDMQSDIVKFCAPTGAITFTANQQRVLLEHRSR